MKGAYRAIGVNRTDFLGIIQMRPDAGEDSRAIEWVAFASNVFNTTAPFYTDVEKVPEYFPIRPEMLRLIIFTGQAG